MSRLALSICALLLLGGTAAAKPGVAATTVNLRAEGSTTSAILAKIPGGARIEVGDCTGEWCAVTYQGKSGFAIATALDTTGRARAPVRRPVPGVVPYDPDDDEFIPAPGYGVAPPPPVYYGGPYYYGAGWGRPYWGRGYYGRGYYGYGGRRWGYGRRW